MKIGVIGTRGGWSSELLADTVFNKTGYRLLVEMDKVRLDLPYGSLWYEDIDLTSLDALIIKKIGVRYSPDLLDRLEMLRLLPKHGVLLCSDPLKILRVLDRLSCTITLQEAGIPMPPTSITEDLNQARTAIRKYGEAVLKPLYSTKARGMSIIRDDDNAMAKLIEFKMNNNIFYIQKKADLGTYDLGVVFMGGTYLTTYARCRQNGAWNTTTASGGQYAAVDPPPAIIDLARRAQAPFGLDFTCVDVAETSTGPVVFEVSAFGGFRGIQKARNLDAAALYTDYVITKIKGIKK
ncbi:MAG: GAK system ATP-grasp enzyme [Deltaproteobacteria bacterium]|nr:GAK system ATP-grasp enzyme [Deltaproteobacteria bacterium]